MTRILFLGDLQGTGFGTVTFDLGRALLDRGDDVRFISMNEQMTMLDDLPEPFKSRTLPIGTPTGWLAFVSDQAEAERVQAKLDSVFERWDDGWSPECVLMVGDAASVKEAGAVLRLPERLPALHYVPIEGVDLPPRWAQTWQRFRPVAMSEFGADQLAKLVGYRPPVVYHGVDSGKFWPVSATRPIVLNDGEKLTVLRSRDDCRRFFGGKPEHVWLFRADRNMPRKRYGSLFRSVAPLLAKYPDLFMVYHCKTIDGGGDLEDEKSKFPPHVAAKMISTGIHDAVGGAPVEILNVLYNAADIYCSTSAEGFGLTIAEAMACGLPAVGLHYSSVPEVIGTVDGKPIETPDGTYTAGIGGMTVPVGTLVENQYSHYWAGVKERVYTHAVDYLVAHKQKRQQLGLMASGHVNRTFTWEQAAAQFSELAHQASIPAEIAA